MTPHLLKFYKRMPYLKENLQWWFLEITYGFGAHHNNLKAMESRAVGKYFSCKEEDDSSRVNQAYKRFVAKVTKEVLLALLAFYALLIIQLADYYISGTW